MLQLSRRTFMGLVGASAFSAYAGTLSNPEFRVRTITAGVELASAEDLDAVQAALSFLATAKSVLGEQYEVQTTRLSTQPLADYLPDYLTPRAMGPIGRMDSLATESGSMLSIGPILTSNTVAPGFGSWAADLVQATRATSFSSFIAAPAGGIHHHTVNASAEAVAAIAASTPGGEGNFRFCATGFCPPGTPFFPAAYHRGKPAFSIGLESPGILLAALQGVDNMGDAGQAMRERLNAKLAPVEALAREISNNTGWRYLGMDTSPAPGLDASIGQVIELITGKPFGAASTLTACSTITGALQGLKVKTCGYSGLMLPVLEDRVLAQRAEEGRYGVSELLLFSSVCGTGLDVVPIPGNTSIAQLSATIGDVAALSARYKKSLSARLFPIPGKDVGDLVTFENPYLTRSRVLAPGS